ncbi:hypothetical protein FisN_16Lh091 [Fistulifera solaris]|uniref:HMG box domain-containing protein n=1 Tax=Fistulifera solaris TaxID=1519565 RepID=A0A1Z5KJI9_FISSO|nr:hypothetical protein FisN_16Lh091 [Fistulifera solaris]|eukprot:GAX26262.1 hypothetical protein FisN_16Lh091 [Fistulifera solaris]
MAAFIDHHLDGDLREFARIFDGDSEDIGFEQMIAQVTYNDQSILSPIRCISPICPATSAFVDGPCLPTDPYPFVLGGLKSPETPWHVQLRQDCNLSSDDKPCNHELEASVVMQSSNGSTQVSPYQDLTTPIFLAQPSAPLSSNPQLGDETLATVKKKKKRSTRNPVTPALSAYNFFFRDERDRILKKHQDMAYTPERQDLLLHRHWQQDRSQKRRHVKTHGKINFATLSKCISMRWKQLPEHAKTFYREISLRDWDRFRKESSTAEERLLYDAST